MPDACELPDHAFRDAGGEQGVSAGHDADGGEELFGRLVLEQETAGSGAECFVHVLVEVERRQDEDPRRVIGGEDPPRRLEPVELGHADVHQNDGWSKAGGLVDRLEACTRLRHDFDVLLAREQHSKAGADHRLVIGDEHADCHDRSPLSGRRVRRTKPP